MKLLGTTLRGFFITLLLAFALPTAAQVEDCGNYIYIEDGQRFEEPISDCDNPFGELNPNSNLEVYFAGTQITESAELPLLSVSGEFTTVNADAFDISFDLYRHVEDGYIVPEFFGSYTFSATGTYTLVVYEFGEPILGWQQWLRDQLIPTAYAAEGDITAITFTVVESAPEPTGASNVLFLPGIKASRLYEDGLVGSDRLWEPNNNGDVLQLALDESGDSINDIYTSDILEEIFGVDNVYKEFSDRMDDLVATTSEAQIAAWIPFPYDWRQSVFDVVENGTQYQDGLRFPVDALEQLAEQSLSGQVTIIAHSNGGLLGKALISELERQGKVDLVDHFIMIGTPQLGTPKLLASALHGYKEELAYGLIASDETVRGIIRNMPGAYGLLPGEAYFDSRNDIVIGFDASETTAPFREVYGNAVTFDELDDFLLGGDGRGRAETANEAEILNEILLTKANQERLLLDNWVAPSNVNVYEIVGTGIDSISGFEYQEFPTWRCLLGVCRQSSKIYEPIPYVTQFGDETVVGNSADGGESDATYYVDLNRLDDEVGEFRTHKDLTDATPVLNLVTSLLLNEDNPIIPFVSQDRPEYADDRAMLSTHSPVYFFVTDTSGNRTGRISSVESVEEISGSQYFEFGGSHFVILPNDVDYTVTILGEDEGGMTFRAAKLLGETQTETARVNVATTSASTTITFTATAGEFSDLEVDVEGDGQLDYIVTPEGDVTIIDNAVTYETLRAAIKEEVENPQYRRVLLSLTRLAERFSERPGRYAARIEARLLNRLLWITQYLATVDNTADWPQIIATIEALKSYE
ncbi:hypothetical protein CL655_02360 [bacterium]|nr:hypothetical protein [bacterium]|tara:strand:+ start:2816 stop:5245 length:2430 start_codon:yes stop_codon:yes gene_type:complete